LEEVLQDISYVQEDLLAVMDDGSEASLATWLRDSWGEWGEARAGARLEAAMSAMPLRADSALRLEKRQARRSQLALMRGLQSLLADSCFRARLLHLAATPVGSSADGKTQDVEMVADKAPAQCTPGQALGPVDFEALALGKSPVGASMPASPRSLYVGRKPSKCGNEEAVAQSPASQLKPATLEVAPLAMPEVVPSAIESCPETPSQSKCLHTPGRPHKSAKVPEADAFDPTSDNDNTYKSPGSKNPRQLETAELPAPGQPATPVRPVTPSWLDPPWPRSAQEVPFQSWTRPGTPSTVCDEADLSQTPKYKFVDGQCIPLRPACSSKRLPPINPAMSPGNRRAW